MANPDIPKREGYLKHPEWLNSDIKALGKKGSTLGRLATEGMPELLFGEEGFVFSQHLINKLSTLPVNNCRKLALSTAYQQLINSSVDIMWISCG